MSEPNFEVAQAHRWFAIECNNRCWDLVETSDCSEAELIEMVELAYAALWHWKQIGTRLNLLRGEVLLATAAARAGLIETAIRSADSSCKMLPELSDATEFDRASVYGAASLAQRAAGRTEKAATFHQQMMSIADRLDDGERNLLIALYPSS